MSFMSPNLDKLPARQAELRREKREAAKARLAEADTLLDPAKAEPDTLDLTKWSGRKSPPLKRATCHPQRAAVNREGLCRHCLAARLNRFEKDALTPEQALAKHSTTEAEELPGRLARAYLAENLPEFAQCLLEGARVSAQKGDTRPAEFALTHIKAGSSPVVSSPQKETSGTGLKVFIGVQLGGLPQGTSHAITVPTEQITEGVTDPPLDDTH